MSSEIDTSPMVNVVQWTNNTCTVDHTNFKVRVDPAGMDAVLTIDPKARFLERFSHSYGVNAALMRSPVEGWTSELNSPHGFRVFYEYCALQVPFETSQILQGVTQGFLFDVECHKDSPLVGWFLVLGERNE